MKHSIAGLTGHIRGRSESVKSRSSQDEQRPVDSPAGEDETVVEPEQNNVLSHIISQLRPGADLSRITLPTFILEERSMLERITNFMAHPEILLTVPEIDNPVERFLAVVKMYLSGWHIKPPGVKKPLNPILGEVFTGYWDYSDGTKGYYISEQTSHHPPKSSYFYMAPEHHIRIDGTLRPRSKFLGNSAASMMEGISYLRITNRGRSKGGEKYTLTQPNIYARGILFGKMKYELGDHSFVKCPENNLSADIEFKVKGWLGGGGNNAIGGTIKNDKTGEVYYELSGSWTGEMFAKDKKSGKVIPLFDASRTRETKPKARPIAEQGERESQRLWQKVCAAVHAVDHNTATDEKAKIEDRQRQEAQQRQEQGIEWQPKLFRRVESKAGGRDEGEEDLEWVLNTDIDPRQDPKALNQQILSIVPILPGQGASSDTSQGTQQEQPLQAPAQASANQVQTQPVAVAHSGSLIDLDSRSSTPVPQDPLKGNPLHPTSNPKQSSTNQNLMDDDRHLIEERLRDMSVAHPPTNGAPRATGMESNKGTMQPEPGKIKRTDTETSEIDTFVDAEES